MAMRSRGSKRWDRPTGSSIPNRLGDRDELPLFTALGRAVSAWEGVNAASATLMLACLGREADEILQEHLDTFGEITFVHERAGVIRKSFSALLKDRGKHGSRTTSALRASVNRSLEAYTGWASRRNDLAHGYVTAAEMPDYLVEEQPVIRTYALLPSHARRNRWVNGQPEFNYLAGEIEQFAQEFAQLDQRLEALAMRIANLDESKHTPRSILDK